VKPPYVPGVRVAGQVIAVGEGVDPTPEVLREHGRGRRFERTTTSAGRKKHQAIGMQSGSSDSWNVRVPSTTEMKTGPG